MFAAKVTRGPTTFGSKGWQKQSVWIFLYNPDGTPMDFPVEYPVLFEPGHAGHPPGDYRVDPSSFMLARDEKGNPVLRVGRLKLLPPETASGGAASRKPT